MNTNKVHEKFQSYWVEYKHSEILIVCKCLCDLVGLKHKGNPLNVVKGNWAKICNFLIQWNGTK